MNVEIGAEAAIFPEKEYVSGIFVEVCLDKCLIIRAVEKKAYTFTD
jgi:hypothetical protein